MINGDAESRSHWVAYALGTTATAVVGTKGAGTITKTGVASTKSAIQKSVTTAQNAMQSPRLEQLLPYRTHMQVATPVGVPFNVINGPVKRDQLISMAKVTETKGTDKTRPSWRQSEIDVEKDFPEYNAQKSFKDGKEVPYGEKGSSRPDLYQSGQSIEVKNYIITTSSGRSRLVNNVTKQVEKD